MQKIKLVKALIRYNRYKSANESARYLLLQKAEDKFFPENIRKWECSGGLIKPGETSKDAIIREVKRETGLDFKIVKQLPTLRMTDKKYDSHCDVYLIEATSNNIKLSEEHLDYKWMKAEDIKNMNLVLYANLLLEFFNNPEKYLD